MRERVSLLLVALCVIFLTSSARSQTVDGHIVGTVTDASSAVITDAELVAENTATGVKYTSRSNELGQYRINNVPVGTYTVTSTRQGFTTTAVRGALVELNRTSTINITMQIGTVTTTVDVTEAPPLVDATTAQVTNVFETRETLQLPQTSNGALGVINLSLLGAGVASSGGVGYGTGPSVGGQRPTNNNFMIEGVDNNDRSVTGRVVDVSNEAVASFSLLQNQYAPEFGHSSGGIFNTIVKSGTNELHGSVYEYFQNKNLNAIDVAFTRGATGPIERPRYDNNRLGATIGGPLVKNKLFYFGNFEYNPVGSAGTTSSEVLGPTAEGFTRLSSIPGLRREHLDALRQYLSPAPRASDAITIAGQSIPVGALPIVRPFYENTYNWLVSADWDVRESDRLRFRYINNRYDAIDTSATLPVFFTPIPIRAHLASVTHFHTFAPTVTNELRASYNRSTDAYTVPEFTFPGLNVFPNFTFDELGGLNLGPGPNNPQSGVQNTYQIVDNLTWNRGAHTFKFGYDGRKVISPSFFVQRSRGDYYYSTLERFLLDQTPDIIAERSAGGFPFSGDLFSHYAFVSDDWRIGRKLTVNLGLRYEFVDVPYGSKLQRLNALSSVPGVLDIREPRAQKNNWAPRIGFAYTPFDGGNTVVRGGFGMAYDQVYQNLGTLALPPQFSLTNNAEPTAADPSGFIRNGGLSGAAPAQGLSVDDARALTASFVPDQVRPYSMTWNFGIQQAFARDYTFEVRYLGTRGVKLPVQTRLNREAAVKADRTLPTFYQRPSQTELDRLSLTLPQLQAINTNLWRSAGFLSNVTAFMPIGNSIYHGLATELRKRFSNGMSFLGAYTWSHNIDDSTAAVFSTLIAPRRPQDFQDFRSERSSSALDRRHRFSFTWLYDTPWFRQGNAVARTFLGGWQFSGTYIAESPMYGTVQSGIDSNLNGDGAADRAVINPAGDPTRGTGVTALRNTGGAIVGYLANDPNARYVQAGSGVFPNAGRMTLPLRGINNFDASLGKYFGITEKVRFQFKINAYNALNHAQFTPGSINTVAAVSRTDTRSYLLPQNPSFNNPEDAFGSNPRVVQLVGRIEW